MKKLALVLFLLSIPAALFAQQTPPSADTYVASSEPKTNYGSKTTLIVQSGVTSFVQFNLATIPSGSTVQKATLRLYVDAVTAPGSFDVFDVNTAWAEKTVTYSTIPTLGGSATGGNATAISSTNLSQFVLIDITSLAQQWVSGSTANNGIALQLTTSAGGFSFDSKESTATSHEPELEILLEGTQGTQGPQGPAGPQGPQGLPGNMNPGSTYYIQNGTTKQTSTSFNIDGSGTLGGVLTANAVNTATNFQINGTPILSANSATVISLGENAGNSKLTGASNQFLGDHSGAQATTANADVFVGSSAGGATTTGNGDVYVGFASGTAATTAAYNTFVGAQTGVANTTGAVNTFLGFNAGFSNTTGGSNIFLGASAGYNNTTGGTDIYIGNGGVGTESGAIRIGTAGSHLTTYIAGIYGATASGGVPVFINSNGQLATNGGTSLSVTGNVTGQTLTGTTTASGADGVIGTSSTGDGVNGNSSSSNKSGVYGSNSAAGGYGVFGRNASDGSTGYLGAVGSGMGGISSTGDGVDGASSATGHSGVYGSNGVTGGYGVFGRNTVDGSTGYLGAVGVGVGGSSLNISGPATVAGTITGGNLVSINGFVNANGTINSGTGFSVTLNRAGNYTLGFPAGSFNPAAFPIISVQPFDAPGVSAAVLGVETISDGSANINVDFAGVDEAFFFTANTTTPANLPAANVKSVVSKVDSATPVVVRRFSSASISGGAAAKLQTENAELTEQVESLTQQLKELQQRMSQLERAVNH
jgi:hypothetical protein